MLSVLEFQFSHCSPMYLIWSVGQTKDPCPSKKLSQWTVLGQAESPMYLGEEIVRFGVRYAKTREGEREEGRGRGGREAITCIALSTTLCVIFGATTLIMAISHRAACMQRVKNSNSNTTYHLRQLIPCNYCRQYKYSCKNNYCCCILTLLPTVSIL